MSISATVKRADSACSTCFDRFFDDALTETLDHELNLHHGAALDDVSPGDRIALSVDGGRPIVSRHTGYENAFIEIGDVELTVE